MSTFARYFSGVALIPGTGEFTYDTVPYLGAYPGHSAKRINTYYSGSGSGRTDVVVALDQLQAQFPDCKTVALIVSWFLDSLDASECKVYPSSTYIGGDFQPANGGSDSWRVSDVTLSTAGLIPISKPDGVNASYGGTPSDQSVVRCLQEIERRGLRAVLYPFLNVDATGKPWRGQVGFSPDISSGAAAAVASFLGSESAEDFTRDEANLTVHYSGDALDFTYRRFILHYAHLAALAGGVSLFVLGSELNGLEAIRGPSWTIAGATDGAGHAVWDYPFVEGLKTLASDVRAIFDDADLPRDRGARENLIVYSPDWTQWMGVQHAGVTGIVPHLDTLYAHEAIDFVAFDNYAPLSDWTTGLGGLDAQNWSAPKPTAWPVADPSTIGFGLSGAPDIHRLAYLKANIEGGEKGDYWYSNYATSKGADPNGSSATVTAPQGDRLSQSRNRFYPGQELFAFKKLRWWWNNTHRAVYDAGDGAGTAPHGATTQWVPHSKSIVLLEFGFPTIDKGTNQPNVFYDPESVAGGVPFWCAWRGDAPQQDVTLAFNALRAVFEYWNADGKNEAVGGVPMIATDLMLAWTWDARPYPTFPSRTDIWGDWPKHRVGHWLTGKPPRAGFFTEAEAEAISAGSACVRWGVLLHCASGDIALSDFFGPCDARPFGGPLFEGVGSLGKISDEIELGSNMATGAVELSLSGLDEKAFTLMMDQQTEIYARKARLYYLIFANPPEWTLIAAKRRRTLIMETMALEVARGPHGVVATITLTCQPVTAGKFRAPWQMLTDVDQQHRYPGDRSCERVQALTQAQPMKFA